MLAMCGSKVRSANQCKRTPFSFVAMMNLCQVDASEQTSTKLQNLKFHKNQSNLVVQFWRWSWDCSIKGMHEEYTAGKKIYVKVHIILSLSIITDKVCLKYWGVIWREEKLIHRYILFGGRVVFRFIVSMGPLHRWRVVVLLTALPKI